mgnify:FL=1
MTNTDLNTPDLRTLFLSAAEIDRVREIVRPAEAETLFDEFVLIPRADLPPVHTAGVGHFVTTSQTRSDLDGWTFDPADPPRGSDPAHLIAALEYFAAHQDTL